MAARAVSACRAVGRESAPKPSRRIGGKRARMLGCIDRRPPLCAARRLAEEKNAPRSAAQSASRCGGSAAYTRADLRSIPLVLQFDFGGGRFPRRRAPLPRKPWTSRGDSQFRPQSASGKAAQVRRAKEHVRRSAVGRRRAPVGRGGGEARPAGCVCSGVPIAPYYRYSTNPAGRLFAVRKRQALLSAGGIGRWGSSCRRLTSVRLGRRYFILFIRYKRCFIIVYNPKRGQGVPPLWGAASGGRADGRRANALRSQKAVYAVRLRRVSQ